MKAGLLNSIIAIEKPEVVSDDFGANSLKWVKHIDKTRAKVTYSNGTRANENNEIIFIFTVRHYHSLTERMRILWEGRKYRILSIEKNKALQQQVIKTELINE